MPHDPRDVELEGMRRMDAAVLIALAMRVEKRPAGRLRRTHLLVRCRVRGALGRLEQRGLVEPLESFAGPIGAVVAR